MDVYRRIAVSPVRVGLVPALPWIACSPVTLSGLVADQERFLGDRIAVTGMVVLFEEPDGSESFVLEDAAQNRVLLLLDNIAEPHVVEQVEVIGRFAFDEELGRDAVG